MSATNPLFINRSCHRTLRAAPRAIRPCHSLIYVYTDQLAVAAVVEREVATLAWPWVAGAAGRHVRHATGPCPRAAACRACRTQLSLHATDQSECYSGSAGSATTGITPRYVRLHRGLHMVSVGASSSALAVACHPSLVV